jgi:hypothetical protein
MSTLSTAGSLLLVIFLLLPSVAFAADIIPPRQETAGQILPGSCSGNCCPPATQICLDESTLQTTTDWLISDGSNYTEYIQISVSTCNNGCSAVLQDCRQDQFMQGLIMIGLVAALAALLYFAPRFGSMGFGLAAGIMIFVILLVGYWDVFSTGYRTILLIVLPLATFVYVMLHFMAAKPVDVPANDPDEDD